MKKRRLNRNFLSIAAILFLLLSPVLDEYQDLADIEFISPVRAFEKPHQEDKAASEKINLLGSISAMSLGSSSFSVIESFFFPVCSSIFPPDQQAPILRC